MGYGVPFGYSLLDGAVAGVPPDPEAQAGRYGETEDALGGVGRGVDIVGDHSFGGVPWLVDERAQDSGTALFHVLSGFGCITVGFQVPLEVRDVSGDGDPGAVIGVLRDFVVYPIDYDALDVGVAHDKSGQGLGHEKEKEW